MTGSFVRSADITRDTLDWGELGWVVTPATAPGSGLTVLDVTITPGQGHAFHRHPDQEEVITVLSGTIEQWVEQERTTLGPGESVHVPKDTVHASFVAADADGPAHLSVVLTPSVGESGYAADEVADTEPWASLR
ncbi:cupin domain-containing protein [Phycicoccus flavus]|uniref:cupin domain-containing protein n=1 Tax=Phycicoccus flavus TaxID=2502783 RepID=UPI000FEBFA13|nr:cupin domain-containing protein [Phycicoccus flavus]NHA66483.1 cupin domain-containing protein [Phycicoccus flavus]